MSESPKNSSLLGEVFRQEIREAIREELQAILGQAGNSEGERLLTAEEAAKVLSLSPDWLYRNSKRLPFTRKLGPKMLRFSYQGILKWLSSRRLPQID